MLILRAICYILSNFGRKLASSFSTFKEIFIETSFLNKTSSCISASGGEQCLGGAGRGLPQRGPVTAAAARAASAVPGNGSRQRLRPLAPPQPPRPAPPRRHRGVNAAACGQRRPAPHRPVSPRPPPAAVFSPSRSGGEAAAGGSGTRVGPAPAPPPVEEEEEERG